MRQVCTVVVLLGTLTLVACGPSPGDIEEIKKGQKDILAKLEAIEKARPAAPPARAQPDPNKVYNIPVASSPIRGPQDAKVTIVEFADFQCPFCAQVEPTLAEVLKAYPKDARYVFKQFPLTSIHPNALPAAKAALAAGKQGKYWEMHELLFQNYRALAPEQLKEYATKVGLDVPRWEKDMADPALGQQVTEEMNQGRQADVTGTPSIFVNGKRLQNRSVDGFKQAIDEALKAKG